ncbi:PAS domain S-box protein [Candidatus Saccharibacteria bacterium]|nr:PAS domain S-box protein [Candidatus Saccharibacteria bacterium]
MSLSEPATNQSDMLAAVTDALLELSKTDSPTTVLDVTTTAIAKLAPDCFASAFTYTGSHVDVTDEHTISLARRGRLTYPDRKLTIAAWCKLPEVTGLAAQLGAPIVTAFPLKGRPEIRGAIILWSASKPSRELSAVIAAIVNTASERLGRFSLEMSVASSIAQTLLLQTTTQAISGSLNFDDIVDTLIAQAKKFFHVDAVSLLMRPDGTDTMTIYHSLGLSKEYVKAVTIDLTSPTTSKLAAEHKPVSITDASHGNFLNQSKIIADEGIRSMLVAPVEIDGELIAALTMCSKITRQFTPAEEHFSGSLASQAATAITNARLHTSLVSAARDVEQTRNHMEDGLLIFDHEDRLTYSNKPADKLFNLTSKDVGRIMRVTTLAESGGITVNIEKARAIVALARAGQTGRITIERAGEDHRYYEALFTDYATDIPGAHGLMVSIRDITPMYLEKEKLAAIQSNILDGLMILDENGFIEDCNEEWLRLFSLKGEVHGHRFFSELALRPDLTFDRDPTELIESVFGGKRHTTYAHTATGQHIQLSVGPIFTGGRATGAIATARDITPLVEKTVEANEMAAKAQRHLRELSGLAELSSIVGFNVQNIYRKYLSKISILTRSDEVNIFLYDPNLQQLVCEESTRDEKPDSLGLDSTNAVAHAFVSRRGFASDEPDESNLFHLAMPVVHHSKTLGVLLVERASQPYSDHDAKLLRLVATRLAVLVENATLYHDVNARRERWEAVFRFTDEGIVIFDRRGAVVGFNPAAAEITGHEITDAITRPFERVVKAVVSEGRTLGPSPLVRVLTDGHTIAKTEQMLETRMGTRIWTEISYSPIFDDAGQITSGIALIRNVQRDREVEAIKSDFISIVSHELRTPLTAIKGFLSMVLKHDFGELTDKQFHYLSRVYQSNQRMIDLVEDLLDVSYIESGKISLTINPVAIEAIISEVVAELGAKGAASQIMIKLKRRQRLPLVLADETRLHQILLNLVDNAIKYSTPGTQVEIDCQVVGDELVTTVADHGVGITKNQLDRLFTKFGRIYNPMSVQAGGTGLGLYIVKNLVENHGGRIWVTSQEGKGSKFKFALPIAKQLPLLK